MDPRTCKCPTTETDSLGSFEGIHDPCMVHWDTALHWVLQFLRSVEGQAVDATLLLAGVADVLP